MPLSHYLKRFAPQPSSIPLRWLLVVPFVLQTAGAVALVGYLSYRSGQQAVERLAEELMVEVGDNVDHYLNSYLGQAQAINHINQDAVETGNLDLSDFEAVGKYFYRQASAFEFAFVNFGGADGTFIGAGIGETSDIVIAEVVKPDVNQIRVYATNDQGDRIQPVKREASAVMNRAAWYTDAVNAGHPVWSSLYTWANLPDRAGVLPALGQSGFRLLGDGQSKARRFATPAPEFRHLAAADRGVAA
jgi:hypothetical protein